VTGTVSNQTVSRLLLQPEPLTQVVIIQNQTAGCLNAVLRFYGPSVVAVNLRVITKKISVDSNTGESLATLFL
jgi:hypothetical protein